MSSLALMRWLEATPEHYDAGMRLVTLGRVSQLHDAAARAASSKPGARVLEVGCGTGAVTQRLLARGASVVALDQSPAMLERARERIGTQAEGRVHWIESTASEIDGLEAQAFDSVVLSLCLSEMSPGERSFVLGATAKRLRAGGCVVAADEVLAAKPLQRLLQRSFRGPQWLLAWLLADSVSKPIPDLRAELESAGLEVASEERWLQGTLALYVAGPKP